MLSAESMLLVVSAENGLVDTLMPCLPLNFLLSGMGRRAEENDEVWLNMITIIGDGD